MEPWREKRDERAPDQSPAMPGPAFRRCALRYSPYACDPTAGGRDGISVNDNTCEFPPTTPQDGMATCSVRRQPAPDRQGNHGGENGLASSPSDGAEEKRLGLLPRSWLEETSLKAWPTRMAPTQYVDGMAATTGEPSPCPGCQILLPTLTVRLDNTQHGSVYRVPILS